jgi:phosphatidate cytidylyltransferase
MALSSLALRLISSVILIPIVVTIIFIGGDVFNAFVGLCMGIALYEWVHITRHMRLPKKRLKTLMIISGICYLSISLYEMMSLRQHPEGFYFTLIFVACIWGSDSGAYLFGKTIGGKKMCPNISPNKTWAGYGGALLSPVIILMGGMIVFFDQPLFLDLTIIVFGILIGITAQSGDLLISFMKRRATLKDTGSLIPGHGGILDRIDALLLALPVYLAYVKIVTE